jgi:ADP-ribosyl-[dinitrogen reductase] hydrolase
MNILDRKRGTLLGLAVGDALGAAVEFKMPGEFEPVKDYRSGGPHGLNAGEWTDDTSMALALADSISHRWHAGDQLHNYCKWWETGVYSVNDTCFDIGNTTRHALFDYLTTGRLIADSDPANSGNGSIMRLAPVPIALANIYPDVKTISEMADESSQTTHASSQCRSACRYMAVVLAALINGEDRDKVLDPNWEHLEVLKPLDALIQRVVDGSYKSGNVKGSGWVVQSLEAALWAFTSSDNFEEAVLKAVNLGDDADTTGAVCGQFAGAYWGESGIPQKWLTNLARKDMIDYALLGIV